MKSSAVKARIRATVEEMWSPVTMYGTALGSLIRLRRSNGPTPNDRAVSRATGSTSRTPYMVWTSSGQKAPKLARKTSLCSVVPRVRKSTGISAADGMGRRNSTGMRNALVAKSLEPSRIPIGTASTVAMPRPRAQPRTVSANAYQKWLVCISDHSSRNVVLIDGRSFCEMTPVREISSQKTSAAAIESAKTSGSASGSRRRLGAATTAAPRVVSSRSPVAMHRPSEADAIRDVARRALERRPEILDEVVQRHGRAVHRDVDRSDDLARLRTDGRCDRAQPVRELLVVHCESTRAHALELALELGLRGDRVRAALREPDSGQRALELVGRQEGEQHLAHRRAVRGQPRADVEIEVDLAPLAARAPAALDVHDVDAVEHRHVHRAAGGVAEQLEMRRRDVP